MFNLTFSSISDVVSFVEATSKETLSAVLVGIDHQSIEFVKDARTIADNALYVIDLINRNNGTNVVNQWVEIDLSNTTEEDSFLVALMALKGAEVQGDHAGKGLKLTAEQIKKELENLELCFNCYRAFNK